MSRAEELKRVAKIIGLKAILYDIDDTMIDSAGLLWDPAFKFVADNYASRAGIDENEMFKMLLKANDMEYRSTKAGVHPSKYARIAESLAGTYGIDVPWAKGIMKRAVAMIYLGTPPLLEGAREAIEIANEADLRQAFVTHSPKGRATRLVKAWNLEGKMPVFTESTLKEKGVEVWLRALAGLGLIGSDAVAVDDKLVSLEAAKKAGVAVRMWVRPKWGEYAVGSDEGVIKIEHIGQLVSALVTHFG